MAVQRSFEPVPASGFIQKQKSGITDTTFYMCCNKYGGVSPLELKYILLLGEGILGL